MILRENGRQSVVASGPNIGAVVVTQDAVVWQDGVLGLPMSSANGVKSMPPSQSPRWSFTSNDHWVTWLEESSHTLRLLHTSEGQEVDVAHNAVQGGAVSGRYVFWSVSKDGRSTDHDQAAILPAR